MWKYKSGVCFWSFLNIAFYIIASKRYKIFLQFWQILALFGSAQFTRDNKRSLLPIASVTRLHPYATCWVGFLSDAESEFFPELIKTIETHRLSVSRCYNFTWEQIWHLAEAGALTSSRTLQTPRIHTISPTKHLSRVSSTCEIRFLAAKKHKAEEWGSRLRQFLSP